MIDRLTNTIARGLDKLQTRLTKSTPRPQRHNKRTMAAANTGRLMAHWNELKPLEQELSANWLIRDRARDLERSNDFAEKYLLEFETNVPGPFGFTFQSNVTEFQMIDKTWQRVQDVVANSKIEEALKDFSLASNCTINGQHSFSSLQKLVARMWARDGEAFIRMIPNADAKYGLQLQPIEPEAVDEFYNTKLPTNGNIIKMGIELDKFRRPVNYYIRKANTSSELWGGMRSSGDYDVIPAEQMIHIFYQKYPNQVRGISLLVQSMVRLKRLSDYEEAVLVNAQIAARKVGFFSDKNPEQPEEPLFGPSSNTAVEDGQTVVESEDTTGNQVMDIQAGSFEDIGSKEFHQFSPDFPTAQHEMFFRTTMHSISAGLGSDYASTTNDLGDTSYSSARVGLLDAREIWKLRQSTVIDKMLLPFYSLWLKFAILSGALNLPMTKYEKFNKPFWIGRRWGWVDPLKDGLANVLAVEYGFDTRTQILAENGKDIQEIDAELLQEQKNAADKGIKLKFHEKSSAPAADLNIDDNEDDQSPNNKKSAGKKKSDDQKKEDRVLTEALTILLKRKSNGHSAPVLEAMEN